jgi:hypothetical protein
MDRTGRVGGRLGSVEANRVPPRKPALAIEQISGAIEPIWVVILNVVKNRPDAHLKIVWAHRKRVLSILRSAYRLSSG